QQRRKDLQPHSIHDTRISWSWPRATVGWQLGHFRDQGRKYGICLRKAYAQSQNRPVRSSGGAFSYGEFRALWLARGLSLLGDQLARVAIAVLVYDRTNSPALTAITYALTFLPYLAGPLLAGIGDRRSRRGVIVTLDMARALIVAIMA